MTPDKDGIKVLNVERKQGVVQRATILMYDTRGVLRFEARFAREDRNDLYSWPCAVMTFIYNEEGLKPQREKLSKSVFAMMRKRAYGLFGEKRNETETRTRSRTRVRPGSGFDVGNLDALGIDPSWAE